jgi:hypothetical protein
LHQAIWLVACLILSVFSVARGETTSLPYAVGIEPSIDDFLIVWHSPGVNIVTLANDIGVASQYYVVTVPGAPGRVLVEFDNLESAVALDQVQLYLWGSDPLPKEPGDMHSSFVLCLYDHLPATLTDPPIWGPHTLFADEVPSPGGWIDFAAHVGLATHGKIFAEFAWQNSTRMAPLPALEWRPGDPHTFRGHASGEQLIWASEPKGNLLLRLQRNVADTLAEFESPPNLPDSFAIYVEEDSASCATASTAALFVSDSLHCRLWRGASQGNFVSVAACDNGACGKRTTPLFIDPLMPICCPLLVESESLTVTLKQGETTAVDIVITNPTRLAISFAVTSVGADTDSWLHWDSTSSVLAPEGADTVSLVVGGTELSAGTHAVALVIRSTSDSVRIRNRDIALTVLVDQVTSVETDPVPIVSVETPEQNYPNPFNANTVIYSSSPHPIVIYNILGQVVNTLLAGESRATRRFRFEWNGTDQNGGSVVSGIYFYRQQGTGNVRKMVVLK